MRNKVIQTARDEYVKILAELEGEEAVALLSWPHTGPCAPALRTQHDAHALVAAIQRAEPVTARVEASKHEKPLLQDAVRVVPPQSSTAQSVTPAQLPEVPPTQASRAQAPLSRTSHALAASTPTPPQATPPNAPAQTLQTSPPQVSPVQLSSPQVPVQIFPAFSSVSETSRDAIKEPEKRTPPLQHPTTHSTSPTRQRHTSLSHPPSLSASLLQPDLPPPESEATLRAIKDARRAHLEEELTWAKQAIKNRKEHLKLMKRMKKADL